MKFQKVNLILFINIVLQVESDEVFCKSAIHDWDLFTIEHKDADEMGNEYVSDVARPLLLVFACVLFYISFKNIILI